MNIATLNNAMTEIMQPLKLLNTPICLSSPEGTSFTICGCDHREPRYRQLLQKKKKKNFQTVGSSTVKTWFTEKFMRCPELEGGSKWQDNNVC